jgi:SPP1 gp7 family putative phage head morphogenesis protein
MTRHVLTVEEERERLEESVPVRWFTGFLRFVSGIVRRLFAHKPADDLVSAFAGETRGLLHETAMLGARRTLLLAKAKGAKGPPGGRPPPPPARPPTGLPPGVPPLEPEEPWTPATVPNVPNRHAIEDILARQPKLAIGYQAVQALYDEEYAFALARSTAEVLTGQVRDRIARMIREGKTEPQAGAIISDMGDWTQAYGRTVWRTTLASAHTAGEFAQMADPAVGLVFGALRYSAVMDSDTRPNHAALDGLVAAPGDPIWHRAAPPQGYACRCVLTPVSWAELKRLHLLRSDGSVRSAIMPPGGGPDPGFRKTFNPAIARFFPRG